MQASEASRRKLCEPLGAMAITRCKIEPFYGEINYNYHALAQLAQQLAGDLHDAFVRPPRHLDDKAMSGAMRTHARHAAEPQRQARRTHELAG